MKEAVTKLSQGIQKHRNLYKIRATSNRFAEHVFVQIAALFFGDYYFATASLKFLVKVYNLQ